jgi:hypothetical protein
MSNMKIVTLVTVILMVAVILLHGMTYFMKFVLGALLFLITSEGQPALGGGMAWARS